LGGETEVLGENLSQCNFVHKSHMFCPNENPIPRGGKPDTNRLCYGTAVYLHLPLEFDNCGFQGLIMNDSKQVTDKFIKAVSFLKVRKSELQNTENVEKIEFAT
jgi:hypothetical protein